MKNDLNEPVSSILEKVTIAFCGLSTSSTACKIPRIEFDSKSVSSILNIVAPEKGSLFNLKYPVPDGVPLVPPGEPKSVLLSNANFPPNCFAAATP